MPEQQSDTAWYQDLTMQFTIRHAAARALHGLLGVPARPERWVEIGAWSASTSVLGVPIVYEHDRPGRDPARVLGGHRIILPPVGGLPEYTFTELIGDWPARTRENARLAFRERRDWSRTAYGGREATSGGSEDDEPTGTLHVRITAFVTPAAGGGQEDGQ